MNINLGMNTIGTNFYWLIDKNLWKSKVQLKIFFTLCVLKSDVAYHTVIQMHSVTCSLSTTLDFDVASGIICLEKPGFLNS